MAVRGYNAPLYHTVQPVGSQAELEHSGRHNDLFFSSAKRARGDTRIKAGNHIPITHPPDMQEPDPSRWNSCVYDTGPRGPPGRTWAEMARLRRALHTTTTDTAGPAETRKRLAHAAIDPEGLAGGRLRHKYDHELGVSVVEHDEEKISSLHGPDDGGPSHFESLAGSSAAGGGSGMYRGGSFKRAKRAPPKDKKGPVYRRAELCRVLAKERGITVTQASHIIKVEGLKY